MQKQFSGKTVIVTGGAQGIGKGIALRLLELGARVTIADIDDEALEEIRQELPEDRLLCLHTDIRNEDSVLSGISATMDRFDSIDGLVNNGGIASPGRIPVTELDLRVWENMIRTNLTGAFLMAKHCGPRLQRSNGAIVNISSTRAYQSEANTEAYAAAKGGLVALTHALAVSLGPLVRVNCICPGWIDVSNWKKKVNRRQATLTDKDHTQHPAGRVGTPRDIAALATFLLSEDAGFISGQSFVVDGGMTRKMIYVEE